MTEENAIFSTLIRLFFHGAFPPIITKRSHAQILEIMRGKPNGTGTKDSQTCRSCLMILTFHLIFQNC